MLNCSSTFFSIAIISQTLSSTLLDELAKTDSNILNLRDDEILEALPYGSSKYNVDQNFGIHNTTVKFVLKSKRLSSPLL